MKQTQDKLVDCPCCKSNACYESEFTTQDGPLKTWLCMTCGFTTNTTMTKDSETLQQTEELTADLIKDLKQIHNDLAWFPTAITMPEQGMIFPEPIEGINKWGWTVVKAINIPKEEQKKYPDPNNPGTFYKKRMDMKGKKRFMKLEFMDAAEELGMFTKPLINDTNKSKTK
tara:strand:- start:492 stop:1004 length:513 start_codon:yes stop_codon:yes gene_type:complete